MVHFLKRNILSDIINVYQPVFADLTLPRPDLEHHYNRAARAYLFDLATWIDNKELQLLTGAYLETHTFNIHILDVANDY